MRLCEVEGCDRKHHADGLCRRCWDRRSRARAVVLLPRVTG